MRSRTLLAFRTCNALAVSMLHLQTLSCGKKIVSMSACLVDSDTEIVSGRGRNGAFIENMSFSFFFFFLRNPLQKLFTNHYQKFQIKIRTRTHLFSRISRPTKKRKRNLYKCHAIPSPTALLGAHCSFQTSVCKICAPTSTTLYNKLSTSSF